MKIKIADGSKLHQTLTAEVDLSDVDLHANYSLKAIKPFTVTVDFDTFTDVVEVHIRGKVTLILECAYTLEHFDYEVEMDDELTFNFVNPNIEAETDDCFYEKGPEIFLDPYLYAIILSYIPLKVIKPGANLPKSGEGYEILSEEEFEAKHQTLDDEFGDLFDKLDLDD